VVVVAAAAGLVQQLRLVVLGVLRLAPSKTLASLVAQEQTLPPAQAAQWMNRRAATQVSVALAAHGVPAVCSA
jgi:hypothetical protein